MSSSSRRSSLIHHHYNHPSFSSSLLEEIYRSFDEDQCDDHSRNRKFKMNKSCTYMERDYDDDDDDDNDRVRVNRFVLDQWMENEKIRRNSMATMKFNSSSSTSSSSDSSSGIGGFSSSDTDSMFGSSKSKTKSMSLKPIRTNLNQPEFHRKSYSDEIPAKKNPTKEGILQKRALKLYGDLKKVKQPISPGGKLASFLNSLFNSNTSKKPKISSSSSSSSNALKYSISTPSTASSYSRSCLSKTPSSAGRFERRSVRFCPVSTVIAVEKESNVERDEWRRAKTANSTSRDEDLKVQIMEKHRRVEEVAKELLKNYHHGRKFHNDVKKNNSIRRFEDEDEDEDDNDDASCCSSDLFELEIGVGNRRYCEELPVYETTHVDTNRAIANGFIL